MEHIEIDLQELFISTDTKIGSELISKLWLILSFSKFILEHI